MSDHPSPLLEYKARNKELSFALDRPSPSQMLVLQHGNTTTTQPIAFKVRITHPHDYRVKPNYGVILPKESKELNITLVDAKREELLLLCQAHGQAALGEHTRKILIQSWIASDMTISDMEFPQLVQAIKDMEKDSSIPRVDKKMKLKHVISSSTSQGCYLTAHKLLQLRQKDGQCGLCGAQTHEIQSLGLFCCRKKKIPLSIKDQVHRGRCLLCHPLPATAMAQQQQEEDIPISAAPILAMACVAPPNTTSVPIAEAIYKEDTEDFHDANAF
jgi:hypothetical protein